ncbi:hypothetical protein CY34DRAFT_810620 [Suillus luteus UH-Slu-Lm8-n1]|uniref:Uncharacterized protein n=1 Tax=Suillus luteus UH-Slu-Lm8-n1 TaxID=930992 RepID=A0A0D0AZ77_9AGAM|nr:hypothetical protein CY34DRAFT_810620 [Suillus luteus UH-Slu-Lm8-n1]
MHYELARILPGSQLTMSAKCSPGTNRTLGGAYGDIHFSCKLAAVHTNTSRAPPNPERERLN